MISGEGVRGMEWSKWGAETDPKHNVTLPFTRMFLGPIGLHPRRHAQCTKALLRPSSSNPWALGTRCHELAMYVVFESLSKCFR